MATAGSAAILKILGKILDDLYELGKGEFSHQLARLKNERLRRTLYRRASAVEKVKTLWQREKEVSISEFYYPSKVIFADGVRKQIRSLNDFPQKGNFVIEGTVGQGKSIFLRYMCARELRGKGSGRIPIFVELRYVEQPGGLRAALLQTLDQYGFEIDSRLWEFYVDSGKFVLLLDAFDELPPASIKAVLSEIEHLTLKHPALEIIITSRPKSEIQKSRLFRVFRLAPLARSDHRPFLKQLLVKDTEVDQILDAIRKSPARVGSLLTTPLMLTLVAVLYRAQQSIPPELPEFFEMLFETLFTSHDRTKAGLIRHRHSNLSERELQRLFESFCFMSRRRGRTTSLSTADFESCFRDAVSYVSAQCNLEDFQKEIIKIACLMQEEGNRINFVHKSIQEFFSASFVRRSPDDLAIKFYEFARKDNWNHWVQELSFLSQIDPYRYGKHFYLPQVADFEQKFRLSLEEVKKEELKKLTGEILAPCSFEFWDGDNEPTSVVSLNMGTTETQIEDLLKGDALFPLWGLLEDETELDFPRLLELPSASPREASIEEQSERNIRIVEAGCLDCIDMISAQGTVEDILCKSLQRIQERRQVYQKLIQIEESKSALFQLPSRAA